ncbi:hypothetical protein [Salinisphaera orenii]
MSLADDDATVIAGLALIAAVCRPHTAGATTDAPMRADEGAL